MQLQRYVSAIYHGSYTDTKLSFMKEYGIVKTIGEPINDPDAGRRELAKLRRDARIFMNGVKPYRSQVNLDISKVVPSFSDWNLFPPLSDEDRFALQTSINTYGVMCPIIVIKQKEDLYMIISGHERLHALEKLYEETGDEKFATIPSMIIEKSEINDCIIRDIMIDSNLSRKRSCFTTMKIVITKHAIKKMMKLRKNEINICRDIAGEMNMSEASVYNYLILDNLVEDVLEILECGQITLASARRLAKYSREYQQELLDKVGKYEIRNYMIKMLRKDATIASIDNSILNFKNNVVPPMAELHIKAARSDILALEKIARDYVKTNFLRNAKVKTKKMEHNFDCGFPHLGTKITDVPKFLADRIEIVEKKGKKKTIITKL